MVHTLGDRVADSAKAFAAAAERPQMAIGRLPIVARADWRGTGDSTIVADQPNGEPRIRLVWQAP